MNHAKNLSSLAALGDKTLLVAIGGSCVAAILLGLQFVDSGLAIGVSLVLLAVAGVAFLFAPGTLVCRYVLTFVLVAFVALHIQLARGMLELHFGVFVVLAFLLVYLDWRVIVFGAAMFAVHHFAFDRLQAAGLGFYCTTEPDFLRIVLHAVYVVIQSGVEVVLAVQMSRFAREGEELSRLVAAVNQQETIVLGVAAIPTATPGGQALKATLERMGAVVASVRASASAVDVSCAEIASGNQDLSDRTEQTASNVQQVAAQMAELSETVSQSTAHAKQASELASQARAVAQDGGRVVAQVVDTMQGINASSRKISDIIGVIDGIAFQTNILALNAAVEAARAGEQGRGFAVVASEVRSLAGRSAQAAKEIKNLIGDSVQRVEMGAHLVAQAGSTMTEVVGSIGRVADIVHAISTASSQQVSRVAEVGNAVADIDLATQQNAALVEEMASVAGTLQDKSKALVHTVSVFQ
ncbi:methyl-accepting chemotaxis protein [Rhodoferax saidenbachensis]|uniref:Chemotaxis protein n=1 Tax=Rhodoferax saidenbachensis TaxID=1484693 RepID=A0A1P8KDX6_9BURK|nr:methyl-accepting chemotaxis protein [Rhodoferax saidenbachensis]APW44230.1 chemotaxis protein [Rhodoferax saidenbachensis]